MTEAQLQDQIRLELGDPRKYGDLVLWRNNCGSLVDREGRHVRFGIANPGGADLIGMFTLQLEGSKPLVARFVAAEIKTSTGRQSPEQKQFEQLVIAKGGSYVVLRSIEDARRWVDALRRGDS